MITDGHLRQQTNYCREWCPRRSVKVKIKRLHPDAKLPTQGTPGAAGWDLYASKSSYIYSAERINCIPTGIAIELPPGFEAQIRPRSSLALQGIVVVNAPGTIDCDYRGEIIVLMHCFYGSWPINKGDRIAQLVIKRVPRVLWEEVDELSDTERGEGGFGSTGG